MLIFLLPVVVKVLDSFVFTALVLCGAPSYTFAVTDLFRKDVCCALVNRLVGSAGIKQKVAP